MDVVINSDCSVIPEHSSVLTSQGAGYLNFLTCLGYDSLNPPAAELLRQLSHLDGNWLMVSPVHWQASHNDAFIVAAGKELGLGEDDSKTWFNLFANYLAHDDIRLYYYSAEYWLLRTNQHVPINAKPIHYMLNKSLMPELASLDPSMFWQKFITETQMFFASLPNETSLNGVWVWGGAKLREKNSKPICADEAFLELANLCSSNVSLYTHATDLKKVEILLLNDLDTLSDVHKVMLKKSANWYWNNSAYTYSDSNWITRLWRNLIHAH